MPSRLESLHWFPYALMWIILICLAGAVAGAVIYPLVGLIFSLQTSSGALALRGMREFSFLAMIWAPGLALVLCVRRAYLRAHTTETKR